MSKKQQQARFVLLMGVIFVLIVVGLVFGITLPGVAQAGPTLPPRDPPLGPAIGFGEEKESDDDDGQLIGALIELQTQPGWAGQWSVVQWQNSVGDWEVVEGWRGTLDEQGNWRWWVAEKDFGDGPFRWQVTTGPGGPVLGTSQLFNLPEQPYETIQVIILPGS